MFEHLDDPMEFVPHETFRRRALGRGRRRLTAAASTAVVAGVLAAAGLASAAGPDGDDVRTGPAGDDVGPRVVVPAPPVELPVEKLVQAPQGLTATPASGHQEGDQVTVRLDPPAGGTLEDGTGIRIEANGFTPGTTVRIALCDPVDCDRSPRVRAVDVGAEGRFAVDFRVFLEILHVPGPSSAPGRRTAEWASCRPCRLEVGDHLDRVSLPLDLAPTDDPVRPQVTFEGGDGPLAPGSTVRVSGTGFQSGAADLLELAWCPAAISHSTWARRSPRTSAARRRPRDGR